MVRPCPAGSSTGWPHCCRRAGYRTLVPDLYGHGNSARLRKRHDYGLFCSQMFHLLDALAIDRPVDVFGHSMGAAIAARLACRKPADFRRLVLAAPLLDFTATPGRSPFAGTARPWRINDADLHQTDADQAAAQSLPGHRRRSLG